MMIGIKKIWSYRKGKWGLGILFFFFMIACFADFIANEKPVYCQFEGQGYFPVIHGYGEYLGLVSHYDFLNNRSWQDLELDNTIFPIIKFSPSNIDKGSTSFSPPGTIIRSSYAHKKHWLGSDSIGRDVAAGIIQGTRKTFLIAFFAMFISCMIGMILGVLSGYFGDHYFKLNVWLVIVLAILLFLSWFQYIYGHWSFVSSVIVSMVVIAGGSLASSKLGGKKISIPLDLIVMRVIEVFKSVPALFILLALLAIIDRPSILSLIIIIGLLRWSTIARILRAELLALQEKKFIISARAIGATDTQIVWKHLLPNAIPSLLTIIAFGFAGTIMIEATISFLGIGLSAEEVTWGSILSEARNNFSAWWLAVFPGSAIFLMVIACNYIGDTLNELSLSSD